MGKKNQIKGKIASLGIRVKNWIIMHGISVNLFTKDVLHFKNIRPYGLENCSALSWQMFYENIFFSKFDRTFKKEFLNIF